MKILVAPVRENSENQARDYPCLYCDKVFTSYRALGGHNKAHNARIRPRTRRNHFSHSRTSTNLNPPSNNQPKNSSMGPNETNPVNATFAASGSTTSTNYPSDPRLFLGSNRVCKFNTDEKRTCRDGKPLFYENTLEKDQLNFSNPAPNPSPGLDLNQSPNLEETNNVGFSPIDPCPFSSWEEGSQSKIQSPGTCEEHQTMYSMDAFTDIATMRASKRPKIVSYLPVTNPFSELEISFDAQQKGPKDIDLSLHL